MSDTFCPIPWNFQAIRNNGDVRICCQSNIAKSRGILTAEDGKIVNAGNSSLEEARHVPLMKLVRSNMLQGKWSDECVRCKEEESAGLNSRRMYELENWKFSFEDAVKVTNPDGSLTGDAPLPVYYDLRFGNLCNLACRMCGPTDSHTWYEQWSGLYGSQQFKDTHGIVNLIRNDKGRLTTNDYNWHESESFWQQLESNIKNIQHVYMAGGEPLLIERHYDFLNKCIEQDAAKNITLEYNTNMTTLPNKVLDLWKQFKKVQIGASIDGIGGVLEYQRWPIKWSQAELNLKKLDVFAQQNSNIVAWLAVTVTVFNVMHMPDLIKWKILESGFKKINSSKKKRVITHHVAHRPHTTNIRILTPELKKQVEQRYEQFILEMESSDVDVDSVKEIKSILRGIVKYMNADDYTDHLPEFIRTTKYLDGQRNQNVLEIAPYLKPLLTE